MNNLKIQFTDFWNGYDSNDNFWTLILKKLEIPYQIVNDNADLLISSCFGSTFLNKKARKKLFWTGENWFRMNQKLNPINLSILEIFDKVYSFDFDNSQNHYRLPLYLIDTIESDITDYNEKLRRKDKDILHQEFQKRKFCTFIQGNGNCKFRNNYFTLLNKIEKVDSYGTLFNNTGIKLDRSGKIQKTKEYKFQLAFENSEYDGYVSEKIIDAFKSDIIPIYWGGTKISNEFNPSSFIDVNSLGLEKSLDLVSKLNNDFEMYWEYYNQPIIGPDQSKLEKRIEDFYTDFKKFIETI
jgi:hypothetical protein